jgi:hypothetical protein
MSRRQTNENVSDQAAKNCTMTAEKKCGDGRREAACVEQAVLVLMLVAV